MQFKENNRVGDVNSQVSLPSRQRQQQQSNASNYQIPNQQDANARRQISNISRESQRSQFQNIGRPTGQSIQERSSQLSTNSRAISNQQLAGMISNNNPAGSLSIGRNQQQRRNFSAASSQIQQQQQNQNSNNNNRSNRSGSVQYSESFSVFHENTVVNQIYNQEWEYRTFLHFLELVYHQVVVWLCSFLIACVFLYSSSYYIPFVLLFIYDSISIARSLYRHSLYTCFKSRIKSKIIILEVLLIASAKVFILVYLQNKSLRSIYIMIPISIYCILRVLVYKLEKKSEDCNSVINFFVLGFRVFVFLFCFSICLKMDKIVSWNWQQTVWSYWIIFSIMIGISFGSLLMMLSKLFQVCLDEAVLSELKGISWAFLNIAGLTAGSCIFLFGTVQYLDDHSTFGLQIFIYFSVLFCLFYLMLSSYWKNSILYYLKSMSSFDTEYVRKEFQDKIGQQNGINIQNLISQPLSTQNNQNIISGQDQSNHQNDENQNGNYKDDHNLQNESEKIKDKTLLIPRFLEKFSNTFFRKTDPKMTPNEYYKQKQQERQEKEEMKKQKQQQKKTQAKKQVIQDQEQQIEETKNQQQIQNSKQGFNKKHGRSVSSIVFDYSSLQQSSSSNNSRFGFANDFLTSLKKGANNLIKNIPFTKPSLNNSESQFGSQINTNRNQIDVHLQAVNTETEELNQTPKMMNTHPDIELQPQISQTNIQSYNNVNTVNNTKKKEQHISIIDNPAISSQNPVENNYLKSSDINQQLDIYYSGGNQYNNNNNNINNDMINTNSNKNNSQNNNNTTNKKSNDDKQNNGLKQSNSQQLNTIIEEKSILDLTNNNPYNNNNNNLADAINYMQEDQQGQKKRNISQYEAYYNSSDIQQKMQQSPKNYMFNLQEETNPRYINFQDKFDDIVSQNIDINTNNNINQHRRFLSAQLNQQINFNKQSQTAFQVDTSNKLPLQPLEEDNSMMDQSNQSQSKCQLDQSSMMSSSHMDKSSNTCLVCFDKQPDSVFMDCGHGGVCYDCALEIWKKTSECYLCRLKIVQVLQVDLKSKVYGLIKVISSTQMVQKEVDESDQQSQPPLEEILEDNQE